MNPLDYELQKGHAKIGCKLHLIPHYKRAALTQYGWKISQRNNQNGQYTFLSPTNKNSVTIYATTGNVRINQKGCPARYDSLFTDESWCNLLEDLQNT